MKHNTVIRTDYRLGEGEYFQASGLRYGFSKARTTLRVKEIAVTRLHSDLQVLLSGRKIKADGQPGELRAFLSCSVDEERWKEIWDQIPGTIKLGLRDEDRLAMTPR